MNFLSKKLTEYILEKGIIEKYNYEIYQYGFQIFRVCQVKCVN